VDLRKVAATGAGGRVTAADVERFATRWEKKPDDVYLDRLSAELGVDLDQVAGSGPGGKAVPRDIVAAARLNASLTKASLTNVTSQPPAAVRFPEGDGFRANPLVDDLRRSRPALYAVAAREGTPPTLFNSGDLPLATGSGLSPAVLARVPWMARHAAASAPTAEAYRIIEEVTGPDGDIAAHAYADHPGVRQYGNRVRAWAMGPPGLGKADRQELDRADAEAMTEELFRDLFPPGTEP
jgi:e3 binding domain